MDKDFFRKFRRGLIYAIASVAAATLGALQWIPNGFPHAGL